MSENAAREGRLFHLERTAPQAQQSLSRQSQSYPPSLSLLSQPHLRSRPQGVRSVTEDPLPAAHYRITSSFHPRIVSGSSRNKECVFREQKHRLWPNVFCSLLYCFRPLYCQSRGE
nr:unnamed protein product [Haemonchus contortus]